MHGNTKTDASYIHMRADKNTCDIPFLEMRGFRIQRCRRYRSQKHDVFFKSWGGGGGGCGRGQGGAGNTGLKQIYVKYSQI